MKEKKSRLLQCISLLGSLLLSAILWTSCKEMSIKELSGSIYFTLPQILSDNEIVVSVIDDNNIDITSEYGINIGYMTGTNVKYLDGGLILDEESTNRFLEKYSNQKIVKQYDYDKIVCHTFISDSLKDLPSASKKYLLKIQVINKNEEKIYTCIIHLSDKDESITEYIIDDENTMINVLLCYEVNYFI